MPGWFFTSKTLVLAIAYASGVVIILRLGVVWLVSQMGGGVEGVFQISLFKPVIQSHLFLSGTDALYLRIAVK